MNENPSFFFRGLDPKQIIEEMIIGSYNLKIHDIPPTKITTEVPSRERLIPGTSSMDASFKINSNNESKIILTTNHENYSKALNGVFDKNLNKSNSERDHTCYWCRRKFKHKAVGIPLEMKIVENVKTFHCHGQYCAFPCAYAHLINLIRNKNPIYSTSEYLLKYLFNQMYSDEELKEAPNWTFLDINGGMLTSKQFDNQNYTIIDCPGIVLLPAKTLLTLIR